MGVTKKEALSAIDQARAALCVASDGSLRIPGDRRGSKERVGCPSWRRQIHCANPGRYKTTGNQSKEIIHT